MSSGAEVDRDPVLELELVRRVEVLRGGGGGREQREPDAARSASLLSFTPASPPLRSTRPATAELDRERERVHDGGREPEARSPRRRRRSGSPSPRPRGTSGRWRPAPAAARDYPSRAAARRRSRPIAWQAAQSTAASAHAPRPPAGDQEDRQREHDDGGAAERSAARAARDGPRARRLPASGEVPAVADVDARRRRPGGRATAPTIRPGLRTTPASPADQRAGADRRARVTTIEQRAGLGRRKRAGRGRLHRRRSIAERRERDFVTAQALA